MLSFTRYSAPNTIKGVANDTDKNQTFCSNFRFNITSNDIVEKNKENILKQLEHVSLIMTRNEIFLFT